MLKINMSWNTLWYSHANIVINYKIRAMSQKIYSFELLDKCHSEQNCVLRENLFALSSLLFALSSFVMPQIQHDGILIYAPTTKFSRASAQASGSSIKPIWPDSSNHTTSAWGFFAINASAASTGM